MIVERYFVDHSIPTEKYKHHISLNTLKNMMLSDWTMVRTSIETINGKIKYRIKKNRFSDFDNLLKNSPKMYQFLELCPNIEIINRNTSFSELLLTENELIIAKMIF